MGSVDGNHICSHGENAGHGLFQLFKLAGHKALRASAGIPRGVARIAEDQLGADARNLASGLRSLGVAQVAEELHGAFKAFGCFGAFAAALFKLQHVQNLAARSNEPAQRVGHGEGDALPLPVVELVAVRIGRSLQMIQRPCPQPHGRSQQAGAGSRMRGGNDAHLARPGCELRQENFAGHGYGQLAALHGLGAFICRFKLRVHPFVCQKAGTILGDAVSAHQADGLTHHVRAMAGVPQLGGRAEHVGLGVLQHKLHQRIGLKLGALRSIRLERK